MRAFDFITEEESPGRLKQLKTQVISQVKKTEDESLLDKIYTTLNSSGLAGRIAKAISHDTDAKAYIDQLVQIIIDTPGSYEEKEAFIEGFPDGYVDVKKMLSGERVHFDELLTSKNSKAPLSFVRRVFQALKQVSLGTEKGPGEFALAVMSPQIKIFGKGDLHIGKLTIELKASAGSDAGSGGGRIGTSGWLNHQQVPELVAKYFPEVDTKQTLGLNKFGEMLKTLQPKQRVAAVKEVFGSIFKGKKVDLQPLVDAAVGGNNLVKPYVKVAYQAYQNSSGFDGMMLMNFNLEELKYFRDPEQMADEIYNPGVAIISSNEGFSGRNILPAVTLAPEKLEKVELPKKGEQLSKKELQTRIMQFATYLVKSVRLRDPALIQGVANYINTNWEVLSPTKLAKGIIDTFPQLRKRPAPTKVPATAQPSPQPVKATPVRKPTVRNTTTRVVPGKAPTRAVPGQAI